jgi:two-component system response regulator RpaA
MDKKLILCVDDDAFYGDMYKTILEMRGFDVVIAQDPLAGYEAIAARMPDIALIDIMMPEKGGFRDGFDLLERLRKEERTSKLPIIMISALGSADDKKHGQELGATNYLSKQDIVPDMLVAEVQKILAQQA